MGLHIIVSDDDFCGVEVKSAAKDRQPSEDHALDVGEQCMRPIHRGPQRLLAPDRAARAAGQQPEPVMQAGEDVGTDNARTRAAASSIASGMPSRR